MIDICGSLDSFCLCFKISPPIKTESSSPPVKPNPLVSHAVDTTTTEPLTPAAKLPTANPVSEEKPVIKEDPKKSPPKQCKLCNLC